MYTALSLFNVSVCNSILFENLQLSDALLLVLCLAFSEVGFKELPLYKYYLPDMYFSVPEFRVGIQPSICLISPFPDVPVTFSDSTSLDFMIPELSFD